jgi:pyruvate, water dikinase
MSARSRCVRHFEEIGGEDLALVGGKNESLGEMYRALRPRGVLVPNGFAVTADAYRYLLDRAGAWAPRRAALEGLDRLDVADLAGRGRRAREIVYKAALPAPSDYRGIAEYLVRFDIDSMSLNPDSVMRTTLRVLELGECLGRRR